MAALYGTLKGNRGAVTRMGSTQIWSELETWTGSLVTELDEDGSFRVYVGPKKNAHTLVTEGNIHSHQKNRAIPAKVGKGERI